MPITAQLHDGRTLEFPDGTDPAVVQRTVKSVLSAGQQQPSSSAPAQAEPSLLSRIGSSAAQGLGNLAAGAVRGAGSIGATLLYPIDKAQDLYYGDREQSLSGLITGQKPMSRNEERRQAMTEALQSLGADTESLAFKAGKLGGEIAGTAGAGGAIANVVGRAAPAVAQAAPSLMNAIRTGGMSTGSPVAAGLVGRAADIGTRMVGGGITGGAAAGLVNPEDAVTGAIVGAALPPALQALGATGAAIGRKIAGPAVAPELRQAAEAARAAGYVMPPSQVKPSLINRLVEGTAGKLTTAQKASLQNQPVTNELARAAIGARELTPQGIQEVRRVAGRAYDALKGVGEFQVDDAYRAAIRDAAGEKVLPGMSSKNVDDLVSNLIGQDRLDASQTIESIKQLRFKGHANKGMQDPELKALGASQIKVANAMEGLIDRNLQASGNQNLLGAYRDARQTLAKTFDVERAMDPVSGNVDANKIAALLKKGRPLSGELRQIGEFASTFKQAARTPEQIGSAPGISPLDVVPMIGAAAMGGGLASPLTLAVRPAARAMALSPMIQNRLASQSGGQNALARIMSNDQISQLGYRAAPLLSTSQ